MSRKLGWMLAAGLAFTALNASSSADGGAAATVTHTGWFSDMKCSLPRVKAGKIGPYFSPDCIKRCLDEGRTPGFISETAQALFEVKEYKAASVKEDIGWYVELTGTVDEAANTFTVASVKRLEYVGNQCALNGRKQNAAKTPKTQD